ncbi:MAG: FecR family protein, partial [Cytophagales bacterium]|nr:FecR family protein [Cytophagales bacterium]
SRELLRSTNFKEYKPSPDLVFKSWDRVNELTIDKGKGFRFSDLYKVAATIIIIVAVFFTIKHVVNRHDTVSDSPPIAYIEKKAEKGIKLTVQLPDGSRIKLNSNSKLIYPAVFGNDLREVQLIGEGYFDIAHEKERPFVVKTESLTTTVLGTKFSINAFDKNNTHVALETGRVKVEEVKEDARSAKQDPLLLEPGYKAIFSNNSLQKSEVNNLLDFGWKDDILSFDHSSIDEITSKLENWYGVNFIITNKGRINKSFEGKYKNEILSNVLQSMGYALDFEFEIVGNTVYINGL